MAYRKKTLNNSERTVFRRYIWENYMHYFNGDFTLEEISEETKIPLGTLKTHFYKYAKLRGYKVRNNIAKKRKIIINSLLDGKSIKEIFMENDDISIEYIKKISLSEGFRKKLRKEKYSLKEDLYLIKNKDLPRKELAKFLKRSTRSVITRMYQLRQAGDIID